MSDIEEDFEDYEEEEVDFENDIEKLDDIELDKNNEEYESSSEEDETDNEESNEESNEEENNEEDELLEANESLIFNEKAKIKESSDPDEEAINIINEHKNKRLHEIKYMEFVGLYAYRYGTLSRGGNPLIEPVKDDIDETIFKEILEDKSPMYIQKNNVHIPLRSNRSIKHYIEYIRNLLNL